MNILMIKINLRASWVHSLKEKRMVVKSLVAKLKNKYNISVMEVENQDLHQRITIGISGVNLDFSKCDCEIEKIINFIEDNTDAEIIEIENDIIKF